MRLSQLQSARVNSLMRFRCYERTKVAIARIEHEPGSLIYSYVRVTMPNG